MRFALVVIGAAAVLGCDANPAADAGPSEAPSNAEPQPESQPESKPESKSGPKPESEPTAVTPVDDRPLGPAPPSSAATTAQREAAVLELLAGAAPTNRLVGEDVDPGASFDPDLRDRVAPTEPTGGYPRITQGKLVAGAGLDRDVVRRILRWHMNELRFCYNQGIVRDARLAGTVVLAFTIAADGTVATSAQRSSTLRGGAGKLVGECMVKATRRWTFPKPQGGKPVDVVYPITVSAG